MLRELAFGCRPQPVSWLPDRCSPRLPRPAGPSGISRFAPRSQWRHRAGLPPAFPCTADASSVAVRCPRMPARAGRDALFDVLSSEGVRHIFGNPGTTELPLIDGLVDHPEFDYVLALQEATVIAMADGYAQTAGRPSFVNVHTMAGLGNAIGNLTNAVANRAPMVVTAGNADRRHLVA